MDLTIRAATAADAAAIGELSREFAEYLHSLGDTGETWISVEVFLRDGFGPQPAFAGLVAEQDGKILGYLLYHPGYDTDHVTRVLEVVDLYVQEGWRGHGIGRRLMAEAANICRRIGGTRLFWSVDRRNEAALVFYKSLGAEELNDLIFMWLEV